MHSFQDLTKTFGIAHKDFYKYLQIRNFLSPMKKGEDLLLKSIYTFFASEKLVKRGISFICTALCSRMILDKLPTMISWECDLGISYTTLQWQQAPSRPKKLSDASLIGKMAQQVLAQWHPDIHSLLGWRKCGHMGSIGHIWWFCPKILTFRKDVFALISSVTGMNCPLTPETALFGIWFGQMAKQDSCFYYPCLSHQEGPGQRM